MRLRRLIIIGIVIIIISVPLVFQTQIKQFFKDFVLFPKIDKPTRAEITTLIETADKLNRTAEELFKKKITEVWRAQLRGEKTGSIYAEVLEKTAYTYRDTATRLNHEAYLIAAKTPAKPREIRIIFELAGWSPKLSIPERFYYYQGCLANLDSISAVAGKDAFAKIINIRTKYRFKPWLPPLNWGIGYYSFQGQLYHGGQEYLIVSAIMKGTNPDSLSRAPEPEYQEKKYEAEKKQAKLKKKPKKKITKRK
jgi:hypothetical protein